MKACLLISLFCLAVSGEAVADISYNYVEAGYGLTAFDVPAPNDDEGEGAQISGSHMLFGPVFAFGGYGYIDLDGGVRLDDINAGLGVRVATGPDGSIFARAAYMRRDTEVGSFGFDEDGYGVSVGYRAENHTAWEFLGTIDYVNIESGVETGAGVSLIYDATPRFSVSGGVQYFEESSKAFLGFRYFFDLIH